MNSIDVSNNLYKLADLCTQEAKKNAHAVIDDMRAEEIRSTLQGLFNTYTSDENSPEQAQAAYILSHRIKDLHCSLNGESPKVVILKAQLSDIFSVISHSFRAEQPSPLLNIPKEIVFSDLIKYLTSNSDKEIENFTDFMKVMYCRKPDIFNKMISRFVDLHKIPLFKLPLSFEQLLSIVPHLQHVDLSQFYMMNYGFKEEECVDKYCLLLEALGKPTYLSCAGGLGTHIQKRYYGSVPMSITLSEAVFQKICAKTSLKSLNLSGCELAKGKEIERLKELLSLECLNIEGICSIEGNPCTTDEILDSLLQMNLFALSLDALNLTNEGLAKLATFNQLETLDLFFDNSGYLENSDLEFLKNLTNLKKLSICGNDSDFQFLESLDKLQELILARCCISNAFVSHIKSQNLQKLRIVYCSGFSWDFINLNKDVANTLEVFEIKGSFIRQGSLDPLKDLTCLHTLVLSESEDYYDDQLWGGTVTSNVLQPLKEIATLRHLTLHKCSRLTDDEIELFKKAMPQLETLTITKD